MGTPGTIQPWNSRNGGPDAEFPWSKSQSTITLLILNYNGIPILVLILDTRALDAVVR